MSKVKEMAAALGLEEKDLEDLAKTNESMAGTIVTSGIEVKSATLNESEAVIEQETNTQIDTDTQGGIVEVVPDYVTHDAAQAMIDAAVDAFTVNVQAQLDGVIKGLSDDIANLGALLAKSKEEAEVKKERPKLSFSYESIIGKQSAVAPEKEDGLMFAKTTQAVPAKNSFLRELGLPHK